MAHKISTGPHPDIVIMDLIGELEYGDMTADEGLGLNKGRPLYVMLDASKISVALPDGFIDGARHSYFVNPNMAHMALYVESGMLRTIGTMVAKLTRRQDKLSVHESREKAMAHLQKLMKQSS